MSTPCPRFSRRRFLKTTTAAAFAIPYFIPSGVLQSAEKPGANDRVGVGYIGAGRRGHQLRVLPADAQIVAVADCDLGRAEAWGKKHDCPAYQDYRQLLENSDVDAVVVATPDHWHILPSVHACQANRDVYCEKPLTLTIREGRQLVQAARKYKRVVQTGSQQRSMTANQLGCELVRSGAIGRVHKVLAKNYPSPWNCALPEQPIPDNFDWDVWCGQTAVVPFNIDIKTPRANPGWISFRPWSGGEMTGWGAHGFDQIQCALGTDLTGPTEVWTEGDAFSPPTYAKPESRRRGDTQCQQPIVLMRYAKGVLLRLENGPPGGGKFFGEKGTITIDRGKVVSDPPEIVDEAKKAANFRSRGDTRTHMTNWVECIKSRKQPIADVEIGHRSATICHLGNIARWTGRKLQWDPEKELFVNDDQANGLVSRTQRKPYVIPDSD